MRRGIDPGAKLTRREWSAIRRNIRKAPRRFTRAFIDDEFRSLNKYRKIVRKIQWAIHSSSKLPDLKEPFGYDGKVIAYLNLMGFESFLILMILRHSDSFGPSTSWNNLHSISS